jgi:hypothetical protein
MVSSFSCAAQAAADFVDLKWEADPFVARRSARDDLHFCTADPKRVSEQSHDGLVGSDIRRRFGHTDLELLPTI